MFNAYEKEHKKVSQYNFIKFYGIDLVLCNDIVKKFSLDIEYLPEHAEEKEVFQYFFINENHVSLLKYLNEPIFYCYDLDLYVLGFTNLGSHRDHILTNVPLKESKDGTFYPDLIAADQQQNKEGVKSCN